MDRIKAYGVVVEKKESEFKPGTFYVTADVEGWGRVRFVSQRKTLKVGDKVTLTDQPYRNSTDRIFWRERK